MDLNIGAALWLAARGSGRLRPRPSAPWPDAGTRPAAAGPERQGTWTSQARVVLVGQGADEQCAGYGRHRTHFREGVSPSQLRLLTNCEMNCTLSAASARRRQEHPSSMDSLKVTLCKSKHQLLMVSWVLPAHLSARSAASVRVPGRPGQQQCCLLLRSQCKEPCSPLTLHPQAVDMARRGPPHVPQGWQGLQQEMARDVGRLWRRNLGRDDRLVSDHGRESRHPFLDEGLLQLLLSLPLPLVADLALVRPVPPPGPWRQAGAVCCRAARAAPPRAACPGLAAGHCMSA